MINLLLFIHIIAAMVYFGLPFTFGRWIRTVIAHGDADLIGITLQRFRLLSFYLHGAAWVIVITGAVLATMLNYWSMPGAGWVHAALSLMALNFFNLFVYLRPAIRDARDLAKTKRYLVIFSAIHHTAVTLLTLLMVFKPF